MIRPEEEPEDMETMLPTGEAERGPDDCLETAAHLHVHAEGELDPIRLRRVDQHLAGCEACREALRVLHEERRWFMEMLVESPPLSPRFAEKVAGRIRARVRLDATRKRRMWIARGVAAAAVLSAAALLAPRASNPGSGPLVSTHDEPRSSAVPDDETSPLLVELPRHVEYLDILEPAGLGHDEGGYPRRSSGRYRIMESAMELWEIIPQVQPKMWGVPRDPCAPDPNRDGRTDYKDVAYTCTVMMCGRRDGVFVDDTEKNGAAGDDRAQVEPDCDELCLRA
jgi:hypothetical protein